MESACLEILCRKRLCFNSFLRKILLPLSRNSVRHTFPDENDIVVDYVLPLYQHMIRFRDAL